MDLLVQLLNLPILFLVVLGILILTSAVRIVQEYERGVIFRLGRLVTARNLGMLDDRARARHSRPAARRRTVLPGNNSSKTNPSTSLLLLL